MIFISKTRAQIKHTLGQEQQPGHGLQPAFASLHKRVVDHTHEAPRVQQQMNIGTISKENNQRGVVYARIYFKVSV
jgi:hypothetical protein